MLPLMQKIYFVNDIPGKIDIVLEQENDSSRSD